MPKRDERYMQAQRDAIVRAALTVLLEKGVYASSLRDICKAAGISIGALYIHFGTKEVLIAAACLLDQIEGRPPQTTDWHSYAEEMAASVLHVSSRPGARRFRLSLQFIAEIAQMDHNPEGLSTIYSLHREKLETSLRTMAARGEIDLPMGVEKTAELHLQMMTGACYQVAGNRELDVAHVQGVLREGLAMTAGRFGTRLEREPAD
jgi:AcrR family transcriptional regulator